jgi:hypothetical protein
MALELFGFVAVSVMLVAYSLEHRSPWFVLVFAVGCACAAVYAALIHSLPFAAVEAIWCGVALRRWVRRKNA